MIRILIADDHPIVRQGLRHIVEDASGMTVIGEAGSGQEVHAELRNHDYDVVLLDITMPDCSGLDVLKQIKVEWPNIPVLILSVHSEEQYAIRALRAGAAGYLTKTSVPEELVKAIRRVASGRKFITASLAEKLAVYLDTDLDVPPHETLSDREFQVLCLIAQGKEPRAIASELHLSPKTVSTYRQRIMEKMKMKTNAEVMRYAITHGLVD